MDRIAREVGPLRPHGIRVNAVAPVSGAILPAYGG
jgi:hypothetical protein